MNHIKQEYIDTISQSAQMLESMGENTGTIMDEVRRLNRSVAMDLPTFKPISRPLPVIALEPDEYEYVRQSVNSGAL